MHIDIVADIACPWCFIGKRRLERALALRPDIVATRSWRAFQLNPDMPAEGISREFYLVAKFGGARQATRSFTTISAAGRSAGIEFAFERIRRTPNTLRAHRLIRLAASEGIGDAMVRCRGPHNPDIDLSQTDVPLMSHTACPPACHTSGPFHPRSVVRRRERPTRELGYEPDS